MRARGKFTSSYLYDINMPGGEKVIAKSIDERTAVLPDGTRLRKTPKGQPTVADLVKSGALIRTSYGTGGKVIRVVKYELYGLPVYTIVYVDPGAKPPFRSENLRWINECVAQDGRILKLFEANTDEVVVEREAEYYQLRMFE